MKVREIESILRQVANEYPDCEKDCQLKDVPRIAFNISLALSDRDPKNLTICDIGGGIGLFSPGCAALGFKEVILVDDFRDEVNERLGKSALSIHTKYGVQIVSRDVVAQGLGRLGQRAVDAYTSFSSMEHWHHSPKSLFREVMSSLKPGGTFVLGCPNCLNIRKRIAVPLGIASWTRMEDWYEKEVFRGHVREPDVNDLKYIAADMGLTDVKLYGRNHSFLTAPRKPLRVLARIIDYPLRAFPSLCPSIYVVGRKPALQRTS